MSPMPMNRAIFTRTFEVPAKPTRVFPLLCPVREYDWIPSWEAEVVYSGSGFAELDCVFTTRSETDGPRTWICTRYQPSSAIEYTSFSSCGYVMRLDIGLEPHGETMTRLNWCRRFIATSNEGNAWIAQMTPAGMAAATDKLARLLAYYLATGIMLIE